MLNYQIQVLPTKRTPGEDCSFNFTLRRKGKLMLSRYIFYSCFQCYVHSGSKTCFFLSSSTGIDQLAHTDFLICFWVANDIFLIFISLGGMFLVLHTKSVFLRYARKVSKISQKCNLTSAVCTYQIHSFNEYLFCSQNILEVYVVASGFITYQKCIL